MIVCHCHVVSDREIRRAVRAGATSVGDVARQCRAASGCGGCAETVEEILSESEGEAYSRDALTLLQVHPEI